MLFPDLGYSEDHKATKTLVDAYEGLFSEKPLVDKWTFSTNGVSIMGRYGIPCIGFGPGAEEEAHAPNEKTWISHLVKAAAMYAVVPRFTFPNTRNKHFTRRKNVTG